MRTLPMFPLSAVLLPYEAMPLVVFEARYRVMVAECLAADHSFGIVLIERGSEVGGGDQRAGHGVQAAIEEIQELPDGRLLLLVSGRARLEIRTWLPDDPYPTAVVELGAPPSPLPDLTGQLRASTERVTQVRSLWSERYESRPGNADGPRGDVEEQVWRLCSMTPLGELDRYRLLRTERADDRLQMLDQLVEELRVDLELLRNEDQR